jgi:hypothetical protein
MRPLATWRLWADYLRMMAAPIAAGIGTGVALAAVVALLTG